MRLRPLMIAAWLLLAAPARAQPAPQIVYLDFSDGTETVTRGPVDDAVAMQSSIGGAAPYPAFTWPTITTGVETRAEVVRRVTEKVHTLYRPYNVLFTLTRPAAGPYTTVLIGGGPRDVGLDPSFGGVAYMDCNNLQAANLVFAFPNNLRGNEQGLVVTIAQEVAHGFGLEHTGSVRDVMHPVLSPEQTSFLDTESTVLDNLCGPATQNSHRRMLELVGPWLGDEKPLDTAGAGIDRTPPFITLAAGMPRSLARVAQPFTVTFDAIDAGGIDHVVIIVRENLNSQIIWDAVSLRRPPFAISLAGFRPGPVGVSAQAFDRSGNGASFEEVVFLLGETADLPGGCGVAPRGRPGPMTLGAAALVAALWAVLALARRARFPYKHPSRTA